MSLCLAYFKTSSNLKAFKLWCCCLDHICFTETGFQPLILVFSSFVGVIFQRVSLFCNITWVNYWLQCEWPLCLCIIYWPISWHEVENIYFSFLTFAAVIIVQISCFIKKKELINRWLRIFDFIVLHLEHFSMIT